MKTPTRTCIVALLFAASCASSSEGSLRNEATSEQRQAIETLERLNGEPITWVPDPKLGTVKHLGPSHARRGKSFFDPKAGDAVATTRALVFANRALFRIRDAERDLALAKKEVDPRLGSTHVRFQQVVRGVPVIGAELAAHYDSQGRLLAVQSNTIPDLENVDVTPVLDPNAARAVAESAIDRPNDEPLEGKPGRLVVFAPGDKEPSLAYEFDLRATTETLYGRWNVTVDAKTGDVLEARDNLQTLKASGQGTRGVTRTFEVKKLQNGSYVMVDESQPVVIETYTAGGGRNLPGTLVTSTSLTTWDRVERNAGNAVDAHVFAGLVRDYYADVHGRNSLDDVGGKLVSTVHSGNKLNNASWNGEQMQYGDMDQGNYGYAAAMDVVGHEFSHAVTNRTSNLTYIGEAGALNEAMSDIMGSFVQHHFIPNSKALWTVGEDAFKSNKPDRDMIDPTKCDQPAAMRQFVVTKQDNGGVHINSGIINNAAYLMTMGGVNSATKIEVPKGIGWDQSEKLWYRANTKYFLSNTNFSQAAYAIMAVADELGFTEDERNIIDCAFKAVEIFNGDCAPIGEQTTAADAGAEPDPNLDDASESDVPESSPGGRRTPPSSTDDATGDDVSSGCSTTPSSRAGHPAILAMGLAIVALGRRSKQKRRASA